MKDDFFIDDILENLERKEKKKINSKDKGARGERDLCAILLSRFPDKKGFFRVIGSGNRGSQVNLGEHAKQFFTGDISSGSTGFKFSIECKYGYEDIDLSTCFDSGIKPLDVFLEQAEKDAAKVGKLPMLCWRKPRKPWIVFVKETNKDFSYKLYYKDWICVSLTEFLSQDDSIFFN
jgi:Holliday junction resolvase